MKHPKHVRGRHSDPLDEILESMEVRVSRVRRETSGVKTWRGRDLLNLYGAYLRDEPRKRLKPVSWLPTAYPTARRAAAPDPKYVRAFLRVVKEEQYPEFELALLAVYVKCNPAEEDLALADEFEHLLDQSLDKRGFDPARNVLEAQNAYDALVPITTCALLIGVHRATLHRYINEGLIGVRRHGYMAVMKKGSRYFVNPQSALDWKQLRKDKRKRAA